MTRLLALAVVATALAGCASTTTIKSRPDGATVKWNGQPLGKTPYVLTDTETVNTVKVLQLEKEGYKPATVMLKKDQWNQQRVIISIAAGVFCLFPLAGLLWAADYPPFIEVELERK